MKNKINPENFEFILDYKNHIFGFSFKNNRKKIRNILLHGQKHFLRKYEKHLF
jgi:hypothetical protein